MSQASPIVATLTLKKTAKPLTAFGSEMKKPTPPPINIVEANAKLRAWRKKYNTPEKVAALHRKAVLDYVVESMAFAGEPVSKPRLKALLNERPRASRSLKAKKQS